MAGKCKGMKLVRGKLPGDEARGDDFNLCMDRCRCLHTQLSSPGSLFLRREGSPDLRDHDQLRTLEETTSKIAKALVQVYDPFEVSCCHLRRRTKKGFRGVARVSLTPWAVNNSELPGPSVGIESETGENQAPLWSTCAATRLLVKNKLSMG